MAVEDTLVRGQRTLGTRHPTLCPDMPRQQWEGATWNVEIWGIDVKAGGHWGVLLVLYLPVLWRE